VIDDALGGFACLRSAPFGGRRTVGYARASGLGPRAPGLGPRALGLGPRALGPPSSGPQSSSLSPQSSSSRLGADVIGDALGGFACLRSAPFGGRRTVGYARSSGLGAWASGLGPRAAAVLSPQSSVLVLSGVHRLETACTGSPPTAHQI